MFLAKRFLIGPREVLNALLPFRLVTLRVESFPFIELILILAWGKKGLNSGGRWDLPIPHI